MTEHASRSRAATAMWDRRYAYDGSIICRVYPARVRAGIHRGGIAGYPTLADSLIVGRRLTLRWPNNSWTVRRSVPAAIQQMALLTFPK